METVTLVSCCITETKKGPCSLGQFDRFILPIGSFRSDVAYNVMTKCTKMLKEDLSLDSLIDKLVEKRMINDSEKRQVLDEHCGLTTDQRMEKVLNFVKASIRRDGEDFGLFIEIIKEEDTRRADRVIKKLLDTYNNIS